MLIHGFKQKLMKLVCTMINNKQHIKELNSQILKSNRWNNKKHNKLKIVRKSSYK